MFRTARDLSLQYGLRELRGFLRFFTEGPYKGSLNIQSLCRRSFITVLSQNKLLSLRGALQQYPPKSQTSSPTLSLPLCIHSPSSHPTPNHPLMFCQFAAPVGLGALDLFFFCRTVGHISFDLLSLCRTRRSRHIPSLAPWAPMSGYTLYVFRRAVTIVSGVNEST
ncbi:hypothetical protein TNCV_3265191 [Trichonephila clavipes]|nr:hypothetical protein TNCV_3265191 [Trichonephila clavipes]